MNIDKFNSEGYYDPTSYEAMTNVAKADKQSAFRPLVYICSPFSGDTEYNSNQARKYSRFAYEQNTIPVTPHLLYPQFMDDENQKERADVMHFNYVLLGKCNELWVFGDEISKGMAHEIGIAKKRQQTIRWFNRNCKEVKKANLIVTDPPYNVAFESSDGLSIKNDKMANDKFYEFLLSAFQNMAANLEKGGAAYVFHADTEGLNFRKAFVDAGFHLAGCCIWVKNSLVLGRSDYQWQHEPVLYGFLQNGKHYWSKNAGRKQTTIWNFDKPKKNKNHPTSKPLDLLAYPIGNSSQENAIVIDTFGGSGSTLMACEQTNRICHTMELDEKYASVILRRFVEDGGDLDSVYVIRNGEKFMYSDLVKEVEVKDE